VQAIEGAFGFVVVVAIGAASTASTASTVSAGGIGIDIGLVIAAAAATGALTPNTMDDRLTSACPISLHVTLKTSTLMSTCCRISTAAAVVYQPHQPTSVHAIHQQKRNKQQKN
jgi:hypothetical protein